MVAAFQGEQVAAQRSAQAAEGTSGTVVAPRSLETFADKQAQTADPTGYDSRKVIGGLQEVFAMFDGGS